MRPAGASVASRVITAFRSRKLPGQRAASLVANARNCSRASLLNVTARAGAAPKLLELVVEVRLDVLATIGQPRQAERPQVDAREQIVAEAPVAHRARPDRDSCRRSAESRSRPPCRRPSGRKRFSSSARSSIACSSRPELAHLVQEEHARRSR